MLRNLGKKYGKKVLHTLREAILGLERDPTLQGQPLRPPLHGLWSLHHSRFRVIYSVENHRLTVLVVAVGHHSSGERDDIYQVVTRLVERGEITSPEQRKTDPDEASA